MGSVAQLLNMTGHERDMARGVVIAAISNIVLNAVLIPPFGMQGAAIATATTLLIWNYLLYRDVKYRLGIETIAITIKGLGFRR
jgi:O-antigen/teichoic acid export membrane protein